jgi:hypothetical protein
MDPIQAPCPGCDTEEARWQGSAANMLGDVLAMRAFWTREFGAGWQKFEVPSSIVTLAKQAAKELEKLAAGLRAQGQANG